MIQLLEIKHELIKKVGEILDRKIITLDQLIDSAKESRDSDTKSSVGDKYETSRAMMHIEIGKNENQRSSFLKLKSELNKIDHSECKAETGFGSVVITNKGNYFVSIAIGKVTIDAGDFYSISLLSPIGKAILNSKAGDKIEFNGQNIKILEIC